jgi:hypothetical protein
MRKRVRIIWRNIVGLRASLALRVAPSKGWPLKRNRATWECAGCARQTSVTAGTVMHGSHLSLRIWFLAAHIITSHSNGKWLLGIGVGLGPATYRDFVEQHA